MYLTSTSGAGAVMLRFNGAASPDALQAASYAGSGSHRVSSITNISASGVWGHACGVFASSTSRIVYSNGSAGSEETTDNDASPQNWNALYIGARYVSGTLSLYHTGVIAEPAIWSVALTADEISLLASGYSPLFVRPQSLVFYAPLFVRAGASGDEEDWSNGRTLVQTSSPAVADHPRIIYPRRRIITPVGAAAPTTFIPSWARQNSRVIGGGV